MAVCGRRSPNGVCVGKGKILTSAVLQQQRKNTNDRQSGNAKEKKTQNPFAFVFAFVQAERMTSRYFAAVVPLLLF